MPENKDALYGEDFEKLNVAVYGHYYDHYGNGSIERVYDVDMKKAYLAGRKKCEEELFNCKLSNTAMSMTMEQDEQEIESLKKELLVKDTANKFLGLKANEYMRELTLLKKELEELKRAVKYVDHGINADPNS